MADQTKTASSQKLTRTDLLSMAVGQIIGVGIMTMTGIAIGFTGRSVVFAYLLGGLFTLITRFSSAAPPISWGDSIPRWPFSPAASRRGSLPTSTSA